MSFSIDYFFKGAISGATGILFSHPIDTIKTNIQDNRTVRFTPRILLRGIVPPFIGMGFEKAIVFGSYHNTRNFLGNREEYRVRDRIIAGSTAGICGSFITTPIERMKILSQTNSSLVGIFKPNQLFKGLGATFSREVPGFAIYFSSYEMMREKIAAPRMSHYFAMGGISGFLAWFFIYPQDIIKTQIQASNNNLTSLQIVRKIYRNNGYRGFFVGFHLALLRSIPLHAGTFAMFEFLDKHV